MIDEAQIRKHCKQVEDLLKLKVPSDDMDGLIGWLQDLTAISALSAANQANAKAAWREAEMTMIETLADDETASKLSASMFNKLVSAKLGRYEALHEYCERLDRRLSYAMDNGRTIISARKMEMEKQL